MRLSFRQSATIACGSRQQWVCTSRAVIGFNNDVCLGKSLGDIAAFDDGWSAHIAVERQVSGSRKTGRVAAWRGFTAVDRRRVRIAGTVHIGDERQRFVVDADERQRRFGSRNGERGDGGHRRADVAQR